MSNESPLEQAHAIMRKNPENQPARLAYFRAVADSEFYLLLHDASSDDSPQPRLFPLEGGDVVLAFSSEEGLAQFIDGPARYAVLPGRVIVRLLADKDISLGIDLHGSSAFLMDPQAVEWLADAIAREPALSSEATPVNWRPFCGPDISSSLSVALTGFGQFVVRGWLAEVSFDDGSETGILVFEGAGQAFQPSLAKAASEALLFLGLTDQDIDIAFLSPERCQALELARFATPVLISQPKPPPPNESKVRSAPPPGSDPLRPPRLK